MKNSILTFVIGCTITVILMATLLVPTINDAIEDHTTTYYNPVEGNLHFAEIEGEHTFSYTANASEFSIDDTTYTLGTTKIYAVTESVIVLASTNGITAFNGTTQVLNNVKAADVTITFGADSATITSGTTTSTGSYTWGYIADPNGKNVCTSLTESSTIYFENINELYTAQRLSGVFVTLSDGVAAIGGEEATYTATINTQADTDGKVKYISGKITVTDGEHTVTPTYIVAKESIVFESQTGIQMGQILYIIPILIFAALLVGAVGMISRRSD